MGCSSSLSNTYGRTALGNNRGDSGSRGYSSGGGGSSGGRRSSCGRARGRREAAHSGSKAVSSARLHHGWAKEGEEMMG